MKIIKTINFFSICFITLVFTHVISAQELQDIVIDQEITEVQPMTGIVLWPGNSQIKTDAISLEYSYMLYNHVVVEKGNYDWSNVEILLDEISSRNHQAVLRFRFAYPGRTTSVPNYIKSLPDYTETEGLSEGNNTWFPDWTNDELQRFTIEFYEKYAERYDNDPRLAFVQTGFGLWAEYHIYDGPFILGETFPSKAFQESFFEHLDTVFQVTDWSISIDAADNTYSPFAQIIALKEIGFGLFDDSFMHSTHSGHNESNWDFFNRERYKRTSAGGEFSYYSDYDQKNVLNEDVGAYGIPFEIFVENFHMTYINGNDQPRYQTMDRIKAASMYMGYRFKINSFKSALGQSIVEVENVGVAPIYYDAYVAVDGVRASESLKLLSPGNVLICEIKAGGNAPVLTIESDQILSTQKIGFYGTINEPYFYKEVAVGTPLFIEKKSDVNLCGFDISKERNGIILTPLNDSLHEIYVFDIKGSLIYENINIHSSNSIQILFPENSGQIYILKTNLGTMKYYF